MFQQILPRHKHQIKSSDILDTFNSLFRNGKQNAHSTLGVQMD